MLRRGDIITEDGVDMLFRNDGHLFGIRNRFEGERFSTSLIAWDKNIPNGVNSGVMTSHSYMVG